MPKAFLLTHRRYLTQKFNPECSKAEEEKTTEVFSQYSSVSPIDMRSKQHHSRINEIHTPTKQDVIHPPAPVEKMEIWQYRHPLDIQFKLHGTSPIDYAKRNSQSSLHDDTDSDSGCSLSHDEIRPDLSPQSHYGMDCNDHFSLLLDLMNQSPRKADMIGRESIAGHFEARCALNFDNPTYSPIVEPLSPTDNRCFSGASSENEDPNFPDNHVCIECGKRYSTSSNLARHRQTHRSVSDKKARKCPHCEKVYVSMPAYSMHVRTHSQGCECPYCGKRFSRPWLLQGHIRTHTGEKPFACPKCGKCFADKSNLRAHVQTHSTEKPYVCGRCGKAFALKSYLYKHEESSCMRGQRNKGKPIQQSPLKPQVADIRVPEYGDDMTW